MIRNISRRQLLTKVFIVLLTVAILTIYSSVYNANDLRVSLRFSSKYNLSKIPIPPKGYLVWSDNCHVPSLDPFLPEFMDDYEPVIPPYCSDKEDLIKKSFNATTNQYTLHINTHLKNLYVTKNDEINCCYEKIIRKNDNNYNQDECKTFQQDFVVPNDIDFMIINCTGVKNTSVIYQDGLFFIQERIVKDKFQRNTNTNHRPFGILMFGIDTISQFNLRRMMPKTYHYLQNNDWFQLDGYNKIDDNSFPNLMAILTGFNLKKVNEVCKFVEYNGFDNCSTLFKLFNEQGLATTFVEDETSMGTFHWQKPGYFEPPTDYYPRPLNLAMEDKLPAIKQTLMRYCIGPRRYAEYVYDFGVEFAERYLGKSIFGLFWTNSFSHNDWRDSSTMDQRMVDYFHEMDFRDILENNVVIFFSDHGVRWGPLLSKKGGYIEERLPMMFLHLPQWFQKKYPDMVWALKQNKNRLTSPYDLHMTLWQLALMSLGKEKNFASMPPPLSCPTCHSLLKPVLADRICSQAGIEDHWCTCTPFESIPGHYPEMENMTKLVVLEMNKYLHENGYDKICAPMIFKRNLFAHLKLEFHEDSHKSTKQTYRMTYQTLPNKAEFDATFTYDKTNGNLTIDPTKISRLNSYAKDSPCINDAIAKKYCICNESIDND